MVEALEIQSKALDMAFLLRGSYAPKDPKEAAQYGVKIIRVDIPRPAYEFNQFIDVIPESALSRHGVKPVSSTPTNAKPRGIRTDTTDGIYSFGTAQRENHIAEGRQSS